MAGARQFNLNPEVVLAAYTHGAFPMTDPDGITRWYTADPRGVLPLDEFKVPRSLRQRVRHGGFEIRINHNFRGVMNACRERRAEHTWITAELIELYCELHALGFAHSVETWQDGKLAGGLYGVSMGAAFFGESMFHYVSNASKVALVALVERLRERQFTLLDTQAVTQHLKQFGAIEIASAKYLELLHEAMPKTRVFA